jgi:hypothetical protein
MTGVLYEGPWFTNLVAAGSGATLGKTTDDRYARQTFRARRMTKDEGGKVDD